MRQGAIDHAVKPLVGDDLIAEASGKLALFRDPRVAAHSSEAFYSVLANARSSRAMSSG
jgi:hypothetical protein